MAVFRWGHSWNAIHDLEREVDRLLQSVNLTFQGLRFGREYPAINLYELNDEYLLTSELPGIRAEDIELTIAGGVLNMKGKRSDSEQISDDKFRRQERPRGQWQRSLAIPDRIDDERLSAEFSDGVLKVHLPKLEELETRHIPVVEGND